MSVRPGRPKPMPIPKTAAELDQPVRGAKAETPAERRARLVAALRRRAPRHA